MTEDQLIFLAILFTVTGAFFWLVAVPGALLLAGARAVLRVVRRRRERARDRETFAASLAELNAVRDEEAAAHAMREELAAGFTRMLADIAAPHDTRGEDR
ncbi:hypothetical protein [Streptomyces phytophilus]|uniref:hypothetical protein n=1 Tax=Streptomyces phytophilus TaxID=722715 RepID=UPI00215DBD85|nr:hypothetical protein [Streptomyces phytophilus]